MQLIKLVISTIVLMFLVACANPDIQRDESDSLTELGRLQQDRIDESELLAKDILPSNVPMTEMRRRQIVGERNEPPIQLPRTSPLQPIDYPVSMRLDGTKLDSVLQLFARTAGFNLVQSSGVQQSSATISFTLQAIPWFDAYQLVQEQADIVTVFEDEYKLMRVYTQAEYANLVSAIVEQAKADSQQVDEFRRLSTIDPLAPKVIERFYLNFIEPETAASELKSMLATLYSVSEEDEDFLPTIIEDNDPASLIIRGTMRQAEEVEQLLGQIDVLPKQVIIEAFFVEVTDRFERELGARLSGIPESTSTTFGNVADFNLGDRPENALFDFLPAAGNTAFTVVRGIGSGYLRLQLQALENDGFSRTVSSPKILTTSGQEGSINRTVQTFFFEGGSSQATNGVVTTSPGNVSSEQAGLELTITPNVVGDYIHLEVNLNNDAFVGDFGGDLPPNKSTVQVSIPKLILRSGEIVVIGGVSTNNEGTDDVQTPLLGDIPVLGRLFKKQRDSKTNTQLLVFIAPRVI